MVDKVKTFAGKYDMYTIETNRTVEECMDKLENVLITEGNWPTMQLGYTCRVDREARSFWAKDQMTLGRTRNGMKFKAYRRFEGTIHPRSEGAVIKGDFVLQPFYKVTYTIFGVLWAGAIIALGISSGSAETFLKLIGFIFAPVLMMGLVLYINIRQGRKCEEELIDLLADILGGDTNEDIRN